MQEWVIMLISLRYAEELAVLYETAEFCARDEIVPFFKDEFVFYRWEGWKTVVVGMIQVMGDEVRRL